MKNRKITALAVVLSLIFSLFAGISFANPVTQALIGENAKVLQTESTSSAQLMNEENLSDVAQLNLENQEDTVYIRIEAAYKTIVPKMEAKLENFDLTSYNMSQTIDGMTPLQAVIRGLEANGYNPKDKKVLDAGDGSFINSIAGVKTGTMSGWMYTVNGKVPSVGINAYKLSPGDNVVVYFIEDWTQCSFASFDTEEINTFSGKSFELTLTKNVVNMWNMESHQEPCDYAEIYVDNIYKGMTDSKGKIRLTLNSPGEHIISATQMSEEDDDGNSINLISRPYCKVAVVDGYVDAVKLSELKITPSSTSITPTFSPTTYDYEMKLASNVSAFYSYPKTQDDTATISAKVSWDEKELTGSSIQIKNIPFGESSVTYKVHPIDSTQIGAEYNIRIYRKQATDGNLSALQLSSGTTAKFEQSTTQYKDGDLYRCQYDSNTQAYVPTTTKGYTKTVFNYYAQVNYDIDKLCIKPTLGGSTPNGYGSIAITNETTGQIVNTKSAVVSEKITLKQGENKLKLVTTSQDGKDSKTYYLTVKRLEEVSLKDIQIQGGFIESSSKAKGSTTICAQIPEDAASFKVTLKASEGADIALDGNKVQQGESVEVLDIAGKNTVSKKITVTNGEITRKYTLNVYRNNPLSASRVLEYVAAPGQYVSGTGMYVLNAETTIRKSSSLVSLGGYGGYVTYEFDDEIKNSDKNPYGIDFIIKGNSMVNSSSNYYKGTTVSFAEPGAVMVAEDDGTGKPAKWYQLAPSNYYEDNVIKNYVRTYTKDTAGYAVETDNKGNLEGIINHHFLYTVNDLYDNYPRFGVSESAVGNEKVLLPGGYNTQGGIFLIGTDEVVASGDHQFAPKDLTFGYADVHKNGNGNAATNPYRNPSLSDYWTATNGDGFDLDWAVDEDGKPVHLDSVKFVKVYTASGYNSGTFGEKSPEISTILKAAQENEAVGKTQDLSNLEITSKDSEGKNYTKSLSLQSGVYEYIVPVEGDTINDLKAEAENLPENIYIGSQYAEGGSCEVTYELPKKELVRIIAQDGNKEPVIYIFKFEKEQKQEEPKEFEYLSAIKTSQEWIKNKANFETASYNPGSTPDWNALALARSGSEVSDAYYENMKNMIGAYESLEAFKKDMGKVTEFERMALGITASGHNAENVAGINLIECIYNSNQLTQQGVNGPIYGLLAVDSHQYKVPEDALYTRDKMIQEILNRHISQGGWGYSNNESDVDLTAMAIQALAPYYNDGAYKKHSQIKEAVDEALNYLSKVQQQDGNYMAYGNASSESLAQVLTALSSVNIDCNKDERFIKNNHTILFALGQYYNAEDGGFKHTVTQEASDIMSTQQALYGLEAYRRFVNNQKHLYDMTDIIFKTEESEEIIIRNNELVTLTLQEGQSIRLKLQDKLKKVTLDIGNIKDNMPEIKLTFDGHYINMPKGLKITGDNVERLELKALDEQTVQNLRKQIKNVKKIIYSFDFGSVHPVNFDQFVTFNLKGMANKQAAYIDENGKAHEIIKDPKSTEQLSEYALTQGDNLLIKTKHLTTFVIYEKETSTQKPEKDTITIRISVDAKTVGKGYFVPVKQIELKEDATAFDAIESLGLNLRTTGKGKTIYIAAINGLGEFDHGALSGWMYSVNGTFPNVSLGAYTLSNGDCVEVRYTTNGGKDLGDKAASLFEGTFAGGGAGKSYTEAMDELPKLLMKKEALGDWEIIALAQREKLTNSAKKELIDKVISQKGEYRKITDLERTIITVSAAGYDAQDLQGLNLIQKLYNSESVTKQGSNGVIFALVALDSRNYTVPENATWTRDKLINTLLSYQNSDGGFALSKGGQSSVDITAMAMTSLAPYQEKENVKKAIDRAIEYLVKVQDKDGEFSYNGMPSSESTSQVIIALSTLGINPMTDTRFIKEKKSPIDILMGYYVEGQGFKHAQNGNADSMATEQAYLALLSYQNMTEKKSGIYCYTAAQKPATDVSKTKSEIQDVLGQFKDEAQIAKWAREEMNEAVSLGFVEGSNNQLNPQSTITRAEFVTLLLKVMNKENVEVDEINFKDVTKDAWYSKAVYTAYKLGFIQGINEEKFAPQQGITREQMAVILNRILENEKGNKKPLDLKNASEWAQQAIMNMYTQGVMEGSGGNFQPKQKVTRQMAVVILMRMYHNTENK